MGGEFFRHQEYSRFLNKEKKLAVMTRIDWADAVSSSGRKVKWGRIGRKGNLRR